MKSKFYFKRGKAASWAEKNILLGLGEPGFEIDTGRLKVGDGIRTWNNLPYLAENEIKNEINKYFSDVAYFIGQKESLPEDPNTKEGTMCLVGEDFYIYDGKKWRELQGKSSQGTIEVIKIKGEDQESSADEVEINGTKYSTIEEAIQNTINNDTIILQKTVKNINIPEGKNINIDLNNINILNNEDNPVKINNNASLIISGDGCVECNKHGKASIENDGNTTIMNGEYKRSIDEKGNGYYVIVNHGEMSIYDGIFSSPGGLSSMIENGYYDYLSQYHLGESAEYPKLIINGGTFINTYTTIKNDDAGICEINGGNFYGMLYNVGKSLTINDGYFYTDDGYEIIQCKKNNDDINAGILIINGGIFETTCDKILSSINNAEIIIKGGKFNKPLPEEFIASGYKQKLVNDYYNIIKEG